MAGNKNVNLYEISATDLAGLNSLKARDLTVSCFFHAQKETLVRAKQKLGKAVNDETLHQSTVTIIKLALKEIGSDFERPSKAQLTSIVPILAKKAELWGTPEDIVTHHKSQIQKMLNMLDD